MRVTLRVAPVLCFTIALLTAGCGGSSQPSLRDMVVSISTHPWPQGPGGPIAARSQTPGRTWVPLDQIEDALPAALPENTPQRCNEGATVRITLEGGRSVVYGPCDRPESIERLRVALIRAAERVHPGPARERPVADREWKSLINDWYDGKIDGWYRCEAVREAIAHLPAIGTTYSDVHVDLGAYEEAVCVPPPPGRQSSLARYRAPT